MLSVQAQLGYTTSRDSQLAFPIRSDGVGLPVSDPKFWGVPDVHLVFTFPTGGAIGSGKTSCWDSVPPLRRGQRGEHVDTPLPL